MRRSLALLALLAGFAAMPAAAEEGVVHLYAWPDYFPAEALRAFEQESGLRVEYDTFESNGVLETKLSAGNAGYDVVVPNASPHLTRQIPAGLYQPLDRAKLDNYGNLDPALLRLLATADPGNRFAVPWMWGTTGLGFDRKAVLQRIPDAPLDSFALLFDPQNAARLADCGIGLVDDGGEVIPAMLAYLGRPPYSTEPADIEAAVAALRQILPYVKSFSSVGLASGLADGQFCAVLAFSGDVYVAETRAAEAGNGLDIGYAIPRELVLAWIDTLAIPADAPNPDGALAFIDFMLRPEVAAAGTAAFGYASANEAAKALLDPALLDNPAVYAPPAVAADLTLAPWLGDAYNRMLTRAWSRVKGGA